jgi:hypothetical protein
MSGAKQRDPRKEAAWRKHFLRQPVSGRSIRDYCQEHGLAESSFHFWRSEIARRDQEFGERGEPAFMPVTVQREAPPSAIELVLASGHVVRVMPGFDTQTLRQLLALLEEPSC